MNKKNNSKNQSQKLIKKINHKNDSQKQIKKMIYRNSSQKTRLSKMRLSDK